MSKLMVAVVVVWALAGVAFANLLINPSFEDAGLNEWTPDGWSRSDPGVFRNDTGNWGLEWVQDGTWTMRSEMGGAGNDLSFGQDVVENAGLGAVATFSIYILRNDNAGFDDLYIDFGWKWDGGDAWQSVSLASAVAAQSWASGWVQHTVAFTNTFNAGVNEMSLWVNVDNYDGSAGSSDLLFDSAYLQIPEPTAFALMGVGTLIACALRRKKT